MSAHGAPRCEHCGAAIPIPPEPPVGTWVKNRYGSVSLHHEGGGWSPPGCMPFGKWEAMWVARGPLIECGPWGEPL